jgi:preprotein translocase subunit SecD
VGVTNTGLTAEDIESVEPQANPDGTTAVAIRFTESGSEKIRELSVAQINMPIAIVVDGELIWAPVVRSPIQGQAAITGGPNGLTPEQVQRIVASLSELR